MIFTGCTVTGILFLKIYCSGRTKFLMKIWSLEHVSENFVPPLKFLFQSRICIIMPSEVINLKYNYI